jgi:uncharacterized protein YbaP (TraB family)
VNVSTTKQLRTIRGAVGALLLLLCAAASAAPKHMLFRARGPHGATVYLLGSVHLLSPDAGKLPSEVDSAFAHAKTLAFETSIDTLTLRGPEMLARAKFTDGATLRSTLSPAAVAKLDTVLKAYNLTVDQLNGFKPWFVSVVMSQLVMQRAKFQAQYGVDLQLNTRAHQAGKTIVGLEPVDVQLGLFDAIAPADQERLILERTSPDSAARQLLKIKDAWLVGDMATLDSILNKRTPEGERLFALMVTNRNKSWMPKIDSLLNGKDNALVVVGAAHLVGKHGILEMLRAKGYTIEQL